MNNTMYFWDITREQKRDNVNSPGHYSLNEHGIECIDALEASMSREEYMGYLKGNCIKYLWRYRYKGKPLEDLEKAEWYLRRLISTVSGNEDSV